MCRLLAMRSKETFAITPRLGKFAAIARNSKEYQGHGWGCAWLDADGNWQMYHNISPIWEDDLKAFGATTFLMAHARSAFEDRDIVVANNMPFCDGQRVFIFNGELRGVRIKAEGRIGAEKIFNFIRRFDKGDTAAALARATAIIRKRTHYIRAMNILMADRDHLYGSTFFNEDEAYFTLHWHEAAQLTVCSKPFADQAGWHPIANGSNKSWGGQG